MRLRNSAETFWRVSRANNLLHNMTTTFTAILPIYSVSLDEFVLPKECQITDGAFDNEKIGVARDITRVEKDKVRAQLTVKKGFEKYKYKINLFDFEEPYNTIYMEIVPIVWSTPPLD